MKLQEVSWYDNDGREVAPDVRHQWSPGGPSLVFLRIGDGVRGGNGYSMTSDEARQLAADLIEVATHADKRTAK